MKKLFAVFAVASLSGCVNGFEKYYHGQENARLNPAYDTSYVVPGSQIPVYSSSDIEADTQKLIQHGFLPFGESSFYAPENKVNSDQLQAEARKLGAHAVLFRSSYRDTITGAVPLTLPNNSTSYTTGSATAYGSGGTATAYGNATTTTYGTTTTMVPFSTSRSNYQAIYFVKAHLRSGIFVVSLSDPERHVLQTNLAVRIKTVVQDSPAFLADVLPGDYLTTINDTPVTSEESWRYALERYEGQDVNLHLIRDGKSLTKEIHINKLTDAVAAQSK